MISTQARRYAGFVKIEHSVFSLPVVFSGAVLGAAGWSSVRLTFLILLAAVACRALGMALNRLVDAEIDARNPRTKNRELPRGAITHRQAWGFTLASTAVYLAAAWAIAPVCFMLSPIPVALFAGYPYLKRFTPLAHFGLGLAWSMAPLGGWLAATQSLDRLGEIGWLWLFSFLWVSGFDIIYATMDEAFDRKEGLHSAVTDWGKAIALRAAALLHAIAFASLSMLWFKPLHTDKALPWLAAIGVLFIWQHRIAAKQPEFAFFKLNGALGFLVFGFTASGVF